MAKEKKVSCGVLYRRVLEAFGVHAEKEVQMFASGFVCGQAEKIHLGACEAAMFRPSEENHHIVDQAVEKACAIYGLKSFTLTYDGRFEVWICRTRYFPEMESDLTEKELNSPEWHRLRGLLCGVSVMEIDANFHKREGATARAD